MVVELPPPGGRSKVQPVQDETMLCPVCRVKLSMSVRQNVEIDYCPQCRGIWLDRGELDKIIERSAAEAAPAPEPRREKRRDYYDDDDREYRSKRRKSEKSSVAYWLKEIFD